ncbi:zinc-binding protein A33-like isoform X2 [Hypomesus transpacificus]|uniref:zinc-binding protein A33-like isoform X1 n=1 Tax=Hypomesus transpacificus TaxID=137520 RepID=UPI001F07A939|nr:zinc-binding protein A33-like isoform X1 [Hypomesus transpacificus]XP_046871804.1 zinc-binding protein A33-like isoform X2 [Hypomesus transpacificus]
MAEKLESYLNCYVCSETFRDPVSLGCHHSFSSSCLTKFWDQAENKNCPVCKIKSSEEILDINLSLKDLANSFAGRHKAGPFEKRRREEEVEEEEVVCSKHSEELKFSEQEQRAVCHVCEFPAHHDHKVVPLEEAVNSLKEKLKGDLQSLQDKQDKYKHVEKTYQEVVQHSKTVSGVVRESEVLCSLHSEKLKLFCQEDKEPVCVVCQTSRKHRSHTCVPVDEAAQDHREEIQTALKPLEKKLEDCNKVKLTCEKIAEHIETQTVNTEKQMKDKFNKLHQFLHEDEQARTAALRREGEEKSETMTEKIEGINREMASLSDTIKAIKQELNADDVSFLQHFKTTGKKAQVTLPDPQLVSGALIDVAKHLGNLTFRVWDKMRGVVSFTPVILDPNTAPSRLSLSEDLTSVRQSGSKQQLPDNPERNTKYPTVLGSEGFSSGKHSWEVEVGDHPVWVIGVARESVDRKGEVQISPEYRLWCIKQLSGKYLDVWGKTLSLKRRLQRIRVQLDWDRGEVSFYHPEDMTHIYTHKDSFTEKLYPHFSIGKAGDAKHLDVKICQSEVSVSVMSSQ